MTHPKHLEKIVSAQKRLSRIGITAVIHYNIDLPDNVILLNLNESRNKLNFEVPVCTNDSARELFKTVNLFVLSVSSKKRQALISIEEQKRTIKRTVTYTSLNNRSLDYKFIEKFPIQFGDIDVKFSYQAVTSIETTNSNGNKEYSTQLL